MLKLATFHTTTGAMGFEKKLKEMGETYTLKPIPRNISAGCGIAVEFTLDLDAQATANIPALQNLYVVGSDSQGQTTYTLIAFE